MGSMGSLKRNLATVTEYLEWENRFGAGGHRPERLKQLLGNLSTAECLVLGDVPGTELCLSAIV
jgi:hypothetical protein